MEQKREKRTFREDLSMIFRAFQMCHEMMEGGFAWRCAEHLARRLEPYFGLYMSAVIVDAIAAGAAVGQLVRLAALTVTGELLLKTGLHLIIKRSVEKGNINKYFQNFYFLKAMNRMQYQYFENPDTALLHKTIQNNARYGMHGLGRVYFSAVHGLAALSDIVVSAALTFSMFRVFHGAGVKLTGFLWFVNSPLSAVMILALIMINVVFDTIRQKHFVPMELAGWNKVNKNLARCQSMFTGNYDMRVFGSVNLALNRLKSDWVESDAVKEALAAKRKSGTIMYLSAALMQAGLFLYVGAKAYIGVFGLGSFVLYTGTVGKFVQGVSDLVSDFNLLRENNKYLYDVFRLADLPDEMYKGTLSVEKRDDKRFEIEFRNVSFQYPGSEAYALKNINFKFRIGERLAFVGMNGSGKTTFVKLLCRLYDPTEGTILLNGIDITRYDYDQYMRLFAVVFQDYAMFAFDVAGNVSASLDPDRGKIMDCLKRVGLGERMRNTEKGIDTFVTKAYDASGEDFSGGEKQKIAIARALYKDSPFIVMDEPTAALDPLAEADIYARLNEIIEDRTAVYISHRLSSCRFCDEIAVFHEGEIIQTGSHEELLSDEKGKYYELWQAQAQYYV